MKTEKFTFHNNDGNILSARLDMPLEEKPFAFAIFAHCFTCNKDLTAVRNISRALTANGVAVLLFDFTGLGKSEGEFEATTFTSNIHDLYSASKYLTENYQTPKILIGHSLGGAAALFAACQMEEIQAVVTIGAPFDPFHVTKLIADKINNIETEGSAEVNIGGRPFRIGKAFVDDLKKQKPEEVAKELRKPLLIMHSPQDTIVGIDNAAKIYTSAMHPKSFISLDGADHLLTNKADSQYVGDVIASWVKRYLKIEEKENKIEASENVVTETTNESFTTDVMVGQHHLIADEPEDVGGNNLGPTPYDYVGAGLGACTSMTLQMYAKRKKIPLERARVHVTYSKKHSEDCENCDTQDVKLDHFDRQIELIGDLNEEQIKKLMEIADKCPVHRTLTSEIVIETENYFK